MDSLFEFDRIEKTYFGVQVLKTVSFGLRERQILGLVGENGAGKTTLMNILGGVVRPDGGQMRLDGEPFQPQSPTDAAVKGISFIHQELNLFPNLTVAENFFVAGFPKRRILGIPLIDWTSVRNEAKQLLEQVGLNIDPHVEVERLSQGERQLVEIAKAIRADSRIIIFDEPTTSLTARESDRLFELIGRLRSRGIAIIYISHILADVLRLCDEIAVLRDGELVGTGDATDFTPEKLIRLMVGRSIDQLYPERNGEPGETVLEVRDLSREGTLAGVSFSLRKGEVLGLYGLMGSGRTEVARCLFGLDPFEEGQIELDGIFFLPRNPSDATKAGMAFLTETRRDEGLLMEASVAENMALVSLPAFSGPAGWTHDRTLRERLEHLRQSLHIRGTAGLNQLVKTLSGGNQQKVVLGKWLVLEPRVFILDEPTRGVDVGARQEIYMIINRLAERGLGVLMISSEIEELIGMCDRILIMQRGELKGSVRRDQFQREEILRLALEGGSR